MLTELKADNETLIRTLRDAFPVADEAGDEATADLLTQRLQAHEKHAWMLRSTLGGK
jgi:starvation-inducible DNA-binding protein